MTKSYIFATDFRGISLLHGQSLLDHLQGSLPRCASTDEARGMHEDAAWDTGKIAQRLVSNSSPSVSGRTQHSVLDA